MVKIQGPGRFHSDAGAALSSSLEGLLESAHNNFPKGFFPEILFDFKIFSSKILFPEVSAEKELFKTPNYLLDLF